VNRVIPFTVFNEINRTGLQGIVSRTKALCLNHVFCTEYKATFVVS